MGGLSDAQCPDRAALVVAFEENPCFLYIESSFHAKHENALLQFAEDLKKDNQGGIQLVGYVNEAYAAVGEEFLRKLLAYCGSVGIIMSRQADGRRSSTGTVFRVGSRFLLTNQHVVGNIAGEKIAVGNAGRFGWWVKEEGGGVTQGGRGVGGERGGRGGGGGGGRD